MRVKGQRIEMEIARFEVSPQRDLRVSWSQSEAFYLFPILVPVAVAMAGKGVEPEGTCIRLRATAVASSHSTRRALLCDTDLGGT